MRIAHLLITYTNPLQTERMIKRMLDPDFDFYIHVDAKLPLSSHEHLLKLPNVYFIKNRIDVKWAGFSTIQAEFNSIQEILDSKRSYDFVSLLSGQDYPIRTVSEMKQFYESRKGKLMLKYREFEHEWKEGMERVSRYYLANYSFPGKYFIERFINQLFPNRKLPEGIKFYGSSMFWCLPLGALKYVLEQVEYNKKNKRFYKFTWAPDEFLFQTELLNSPFSNKVINENGHYYKHPPHTPNPLWLGVNDLNDVMQSDRIFARKFNMERDPEVLNELDKLIDLRAQNL